jgi:hypothetical protein
VIRPEHQIGVFDAHQQSVALLLGHTTAEGQDHPGALPLDLPHLAGPGAELLLGLLPDAAGVEDDQVRVFGRVGGDVTFAGHQADHPLGVVFVHLAPEGVDVEPLRRKGGGERQRPHGRRGGDLAEDGQAAHGDWET